MSAASGSSEHGSARPFIAVVGAGIGGLTVAACLQRAGASVRVYEQATAFARVGTGIQMGPNAMKILAGLGIADRLGPVSYSPGYLGNREWDSGERTFALPVGADAEERYGAPYYLLHRGDLHAELQGVVPSEIIELQSRLIHIEPEDNRVRLEFENKPPVYADLVIGADGVHSIIREQLFTPDAAVYSGKVAYRAVFPTELVQGEKPEPATKWWGPDRHIVIYYVSAGREIYFTTGVPETGWVAESWSAKGDMDELRAAFAGFHPEVQRVLEACPSVNKWAIYEREPLPTWHMDRVVLLGDACHPMTPYMAQGAATSMEDAVVLSRCLAEYGYGDYDAAFSAFEATRKPRTSEIQAESGRNTWLRHETDPSWVYSYNAWQEPLSSGDAVAQPSGA